MADISLLSNRESLVSLKFSPLAIRVDRYASTFGSDSTLAQVLHQGARVVSCLSKHVVVHINITDDDPESLIVSEETTEYGADVLSDIAIAIHRWLLLGNNVTTYYKTGVPLTILLLWRFNNSSNRSLLDMYTSLKYRFPECHLSIDQAMAIPMAYARYRDKTYVPPSDLMRIYHSNETNDR